jgi:hypothetical protein
VSHGDEIWWNGGDESGEIGLNGYEGDYLTATSMYHPADPRNEHLAQYEIYAGSPPGRGAGPSSTGGALPHASAPAQGRCTTPTTLPWRR